jgi:hypothetical protein
MRSILKEAAKDARYLLNRGYPKDYAIRFVSDHYRLVQEERFVLMRAVVPVYLSQERQSKLLPVDALSGRAVLVDGYNVLITVESLIAGAPVYSCDDGFLRDVKGIFHRYKTGELTEKALDEILGLLNQTSQVLVLLDRQISMSGNLAAQIRRKMAEKGILGSSKTSLQVDYRLKEAKDVVATADGHIVDAVSKVVDLPAEIARRRDIDVLLL